MNGRRIPIGIPIPPKRSSTPLRNGQRSVSIGTPILVQGCLEFIQKREKADTDWYTDAAQGVSEFI